MKANTLCLAVVFALIAVVATTLVPHEAHGTALKRDISELNFFERILLRTTHPEVYNSWFGSSGKPPGITEEYSPLVALLNVDLPTLVLLLSGSEDVVRLPSLYYEFGWYWCYIGVCSGFLQKIDFSGPEIRNANLTTLNTKINATNIELDFQIPDLQLITENFTLDDEDLVTGERTFWRGSSIFIRNYTMKVSGNLGMVPGVGIQVSNLTMSFGVDDMRWRYENATHTLPDGTIEEWGEQEDDFTEYINQGWGSYAGEIQASAVTFLNCFLSNGRSGNSDCGDVLNDKLQRENFVQFLQNIGLGIARSQEKAEFKESIRNVNVAMTNQKLNLLPEFASPTINSILLGLSTLLLEFGKQLGIPGYPVIPVEGFTLSYDYTWENCTMGDCQNIHEQMTLPTYTLAGLPDYRLQLDFQPNNFSYSLKVPSSMSFTSDTYQYESSVVETGHKEVCLGLQLTVQNAAFAINGDLNFIEGVGIQVSNLGLTLILGELQFRVPQYYTVDNGEQSAIAEFSVDAAPQVMERWRAVDEDGVTFERKYEQHVETLINSLLSGRPM